LHLSTEKLAKAYGFLWALRDVCLDFEPGDLTALLGPNGAGKTTLLRLLAGLTGATAGTVRFDGAEFAPGSIELRHKIGFLAPADHVYEHLTAAENLRFFASLYGRPGDTAAIEDNLTAVNLAARGDEYVANLSSGLKCRLSIAKWRLLQPEFLLLDEPYGVLDGSGVDLLEDFLRAQCARGGIVVIASHHIARALQLCTRAVILHQGRVTFDERKQQPWPSFDRAFGEFLPRGDS
jgi:heme ABC exporter ATP-binding subunit CcmA